MTNGDDFRLLRHLGREETSLPAGHVAIPSDQWQRLFLSAYEDMPQVCYYLIRFPGPDSPPRIGALPHRDRSRWAVIFLASREAAHPRVADLRPAERADHNSTTPMMIGEWPPQCFGSARVRSWPEPPVRRSAAVRQLSRRTRRSAGATNTDVP